MSHEQQEQDHRYWDRHNGLLISIISGVIALGMTLILGSYGYTWIELKAEQEEKRAWRTEYQRVLDRKFEEVKQGQDKLLSIVHDNNTTTKDILLQILNEQKKIRR